MRFQVSSSWRRTVKKRASMDFVASVEMSRIRIEVLAFQVPIPRLLPR